MELFFFFFVICHLSPVLSNIRKLLVFQPRIGIYMMFKDLFEILWFVACLMPHLPAFTYFTNLNPPPLFGGCPKLQLVGMLDSSGEKQMRHSYILYI